MIAVLIVWQIHNTKEAKKQFLDFWKSQVPVNDRGKLIGEFLSEPMGDIPEKYSTFVFLCPVTAITRTTGISM